MDSFNQALELIFKLEGHDKLTNDPQDLGGLTKWGISQKAFPHLDIKNLTKKQAIYIYRKHYWEAIRADKFHLSISLCLFDCAVNQGVLTAIRLAQKVMRVKQDGKIGPVTISKLERANPRIFTENYLAERALRYSKTRSFSRFGRGWLKRLFIICNNSSKIIEETNFKKAGIL